MHTIMELNIPSEIWDLIVSHFDAVDQASASRVRQYETFGDARKQLGILRLVNKTFSSGASPRLFRHIIATVSESQGSPLERVVHLSNSPYGAHVRQIDVGFACFGDHCPEISPLYAEDLAEVLSSCLVKFPNIRALRFQDPPPSFSREKAEKFVNTVISTLHYVQLPHLRELNIGFPVTYDFNQFFPGETGPLQIPIENVLQNLSHLGVYVSEFTSQRGQRYWKTPIPAAYSALPNETHAHFLFRLVELATNLKSLSIASTDILNLDDLNFSPSLRLRSLTLKSVSISSHTLLALIEQSNESITHIELQLVKLRSGEWQHILSQMRQLPNLVDLFIESSGYSLEGSSSHLSPGLLPPPDDPMDIETGNYEDIHALEALQHQVNMNRTAVGFAPVGVIEYRHLHKRYWIAES
ncbi:hypothetical protein BDW59DRAFT_164992 [Aspergillus cavernicola]|uniref:F-box domain-containing protein n=1 Tax=Aspergillus cavernicola TaxID=176166 RepID=A0ABR4HVZ2_9EURO